MGSIPTESKTIGRLTVDLKWVDAHNKVHLVSEVTPEDFEQPIFVLASVAKWILEKREAVWFSIALNVHSSF